MKIINAEFIHNEKKDHHTYRNADGQSEDVDKRKNFILRQVSPGNFEIVFNHV